MTAHASCCILNTFWPIITKNVLHSTYFTTDLYHRMTHMATSPPAPVVVISKVIVSFLKDNWSTGGGFYFPFDADRLLLPASMKLHKSMESWHPPGLCFYPKCQQDAGLAQEEQAEGGEPSPCPSAQHWWGHTWSSQYKPDLDVLEWLHGGDLQEMRLRGLGLGSWSKRKPRRHLVNVHKDLTGRN